MIMQSFLCSPGKPVFEMRQCRHWHRCLLGLRIHILELCSVSFRSVHLSRPTNKPFVGASISTESAIPFNSLSFLLLGVLALAVALLLVRATLAVAYRGLNWRSTSLLLTPLPATARRSTLSARSVRRNLPGTGLSTPSAAGLGSLSTAQTSPGFWSFLSSSFHLLQQKQRWSYSQQPRLRGSSE